MSLATIVFESRRFRVERRRFELRGVRHTHDIVVHPGSAVVLPVLDDGGLVLIYNYRVAVGQELLELPAGTLAEGEPPAACAARELAEETGYRAARLAPLVSFYSSPGIMTERLHVFLATGLTPGQTALESAEQIRVTTFTPAQAWDAVRDGRICDAKTIAALLYYERLGHGQGDRP